MERALEQHEQAEEAEVEQEDVEVFVVTLSDTVADPGTVVIEVLDAIIAEVAVRGPGRAEELAAPTEA